MKRNETYNTKQKEIILRAIKKKNSTFTIKEIYNDLKENIGLTTIYRLVNNLQKDGLLNKTVGSNNTTYYEYLEKCDHDNHFYLKCQNCMKIKHIDCDCINDLSSHILNYHNFILNKEKIVINGICSSCRKV